MTSQEVLNHLNKAESYLDAKMYAQAYDEIQDCKEALQSQEQEPVAWMDVNDKMPPEEVNFLSFSNVYGYQISMYSNNSVNSTGLPTFDKLKITKWMRIPLYTHPKEWQELSDDEIENIFANIGLQSKGKNLSELVIGFARAILAKAKEKNYV